MKRNNISFDIIWTIFSTGIFAISQLFIVMILSKMGSLKDLGTYTLGLAISAPILLFSNLQIGQLLIADYGKKYNFNQFKSALYYSLGLGYLILIIISFFYINNEKKLLVVILCLGLFKSTESISDLYLSYLQRELQIQRIAKLRIIRSTINSLSFIFVFFISRDLIFSLFIQLFLAILRLILVEYRKIAIHEVQKVKKHRALKDIWKIGIPLGFVALMNSVTSNIPNYLLEMYIDIESVAIFGTLTYIFVVANLIISPLTMYVSPLFSRAYYYKNPQKLNNYIFLFSLLSLLVYLIIFSAIYFLGEFILNVIFNPKIAEYNNLLLLLSVGILFSFFIAIFNVAIITLEVIKIQPLFNFINMILTLILGLLIIEKYSIEGAVYLLVFSRFNQLIFSCGLYIYGYIKFKSYIRSDENNESTSSSRDRFL